MEDQVLVNQHQAGGLVDNQQQQQQNNAIVPRGQHNMMSISLKDALRVVHTLNGKTSHLGYFLAGCDELLSMVQDIPRAEQPLVKLTKTKLEGEAKDFTEFSNFNTVDALKNYLTDIFQKNQSVYELQGELRTTVQGTNESVIRYAQRIREIGRRIIKAFKQEERPNDARLAAYRLQL